MKRIAALMLALFAVANVHAFDSFTISAIRVDGLSRIAPGTVFTYLPVEKGDTLTTQSAEESIRALYKTGFFNDVQLSRQGDILVVTVTERPQISKIALRGNKDIKDEDLRKGLKGIGLSEGETFDPLKLEGVQGELIRQYYNRGKYNVSVKTAVVNLDRNRVEVAITVAEGKAARIKHINVVGNTTYTDKDIESDFESGTSNFLSWYTKNDQYSREKLSGDLETLTSYYMDRGYVDFNVDSSQVSISPDKRSIYVVTNVTEGETYTISEIKLTGTLVLNEADLRKFIQFAPGELFSRKKVEEASDAMISALSNIGYAFADAKALPTIDKKTHEVSINFFIDPGKRVYVRRVEFKGNLRTQDDVLRREMRQLEGAWYSQAAIDRSKIRLQRLGYFKTVSIDTSKVPGTEDQIDVDVSVEEQNSGSFSFGLGFSQVQGLIINGSLREDNLFGTGERIGLTASQSSYQELYQLSYFEPYLTDDGIGLGYNLRHTSIDQGEANIANYLTSTDSFETYLGFPVTENDSINAQIGINQTAISLYPDSPPSFINYIVNIGHRTFHTWSAQLSWSHDTLNKFWNPTRGSIQSISAEVALPGSTVEYYKLGYRFAQYLPITNALTFHGGINVGYGDTYRDPTSVLDPRQPRYNEDLSGLPFFEHFYAGGVSDVRGFRDNTLGPFEVSDPLLCPPSESRCRQPIGGSFKTVGTAEVIFPTPFMKGSDTTRFSFFVDVGNVFKDIDSFDANELRASTGISFRWRAPIGPIVINFAQPIRKKSGDDIEKIQFTFGNTF